jgi:hypothetical protein
MATESKETKSEVKKEAPAKRKAIHISTATTTTGRIVVTALCDDGSIWKRDLMSEKDPWTEIPSL